jgi:hypothetical protein
MPGNKRNFDRPSRSANISKSQYEKPAKWFKDKKIQQQKFKGKTDYQREFGEKKNKYGQFTGR